jgi:hypothetical protein
MVFMGSEIYYLILPYEAISPQLLAFSKISYPQGFGLMLTADC